MRNRVASPASLLPLLSLVGALAALHGCAGLIERPYEPPPPPAMVDEAGACAVKGLCVAGYTWDMDTCGCVPGTSCGETVCAPGLACCNASCGLCVRPGDVCSQDVCAAPVRPADQRR